jgi:S-adenosylmethionine decarboxylase
MSSVTSVNILEDHSANPPFSGFDGVEKLLEIWFAESSDSETVRDPLGLRGVKREIWEEMLDLVRCKVLSVINGDEVDAYLLR